MLTKNEELAYCIGHSRKKMNELFSKLYATIHHLTVMQIFYQGTVLKSAINCK